MDKTRREADEFLKYLNPNSLFDQALARKFKWIDDTRGHFFKNCSKRKTDRKHV